MVAKLYWPEASRESKADILERVDQIAEKESQVKGHVPEMVWFHKFDDTSTADIRRMLGIPDAEQGGRVSYIIVFRKLSLITTLSGKEFLHAWWHAVLCHHVLLEKGVHHLDISPSNLMFYRTASGTVIVVLNDYDLSSIRNVPSGQERTGTVPFMAMALLTDKAIAGQVEHLYRNDVESFIRVLFWVHLRNEDGQLLCHGRPLDSWLRMGFKRCKEKKGSFLPTRIQGLVDVVREMQKTFTTQAPAVSVLPQVAQPPSMTGLIQAISLLNTYTDITTSKERLAIANYLGAHESQVIIFCSLDEATRLAWLEEKRLLCGGEQCQA